MTLRPLLNVREARAALGGISTGLLYRLMADGELAFVKVAGRTMFRQEDLDRYVESNVRPRTPAGRAA